LLGPCSRIRNRRHSLLGRTTADVIFTANTAAKIKAMADAAMTIVFMGISRNESFD